MATTPMVVALVSVAALVMLPRVTSLGELPDPGGGAKLELVQTVFRHGDRSALARIPTMPPVTWPQGMGQLSPKGMLQHYQLGTYFRRRYIDHFNLIPADYDPRQMWIRSTDVDRTIMSAQSQLAGWFPQKGSIFGNNSLMWRPIPVHTLNVPDGLLRPYDKDVCPKFTKLEAEHYQTMEWREELDESLPATVCQGVELQPDCTNREFIKAVGKLSGVTDLGLSTIWEVSDTLVCRKSFGFPLPNWASASEEGEAVYNQLSYLEDWDMYELYHGTTERRLTGGTLVKEMIARMQDKLNRTNTDAQAMNVLLYSAHDTTVAAFLEALNTNHWRTASPPYAASVTLELYTYPDDKPPFVRVIYKNNSHTDDWETDGHLLTVPGCDDTACSLSDFIDSTKAIVPTDWAAECGIRSSSSSSSWNKPVVVVAAAVIGVAVLCVVLLLVRRWQSKRRQTYPTSHFLNDDEASSEEENLWSAQ